MKERQAKVRVFISQWSSCKFSDVFSTCFYERSCMIISGSKRKKQLPPDAHLIKRTLDGGLNECESGP